MSRLVEGKPVRLAQYCPHARTGSGKVPAPVDQVGFASNLALELISHRPVTSFEIGHLIPDDHIEAVPFHEVSVIPSWTKDCSCRMRTAIGARGYGLTWHYAPNKTGCLAIIACTDHRVFRGGILPLEEPALTCRCPASGMTTLARSGDGLSKPQISIGFF